MFVNIANASVYEHQVKVSEFINELPMIESATRSFKQEKIIKNASRPLRSDGVFMFEKNKGVTFFTKHPVETTVSYNNRDYKQINDVILAISNKKYSKLEKEFSFYYKKNNKEWILGLKPKHTCPAKDYISSITVWGTNDINKIEINFKNGNITKLWFSKI